MGKAVIVYNERDDKYSVLTEYVAEEFSRRGIETEGLCVGSIDSKNEYTAFLQNANADYLCTLDMAGAWLDTLLEVPVYNILTAKQLHIIINQESLAPYRDKEFALNLFFAVPGAVSAYGKEYPYILNIDEYPPFEMDERNVILDSDTNREIVKFVMDKFWGEAEES